ncbi:hypothetical protein NXW13_00740 [Bacteroides thetaiotaomicron]|nr:hypothetical protein [Bacteroides thetaiotaomicron]
MHFTYADYECSISAIGPDCGRFMLQLKLSQKVNEWINLHEAEILSLRQAQKGKK